MTTEKKTRITKKTDSEKAQFTWLTQTIGKRKSSIARLYIKDGEGKILVNGRDLTDYFPKATSRYVIKQPLNLFGISGKYNIKINVKGGGITGQAGAIRLAVARALQNINAEYRADLKKAGFLTRDARKVERKKYGLAGARKAFQFSKR